MSETRDSSPSPAKVLSDLAISASQSNGFPHMLMAEIDKRGIKINICPSGMEVIKLTPQSLRDLMSFVKHYFF